MSRVRAGRAACLLAMPLLVLLAQNPRRGAAPAPATLGLEQGLLEFDTPEFTLKLVKASQTVAALQPKGAGGFDFTPADRLEARASDRFNSLGDLTFRARSGTSGAWQHYSTSAARHPVEALPVRAPYLAAANLAATLPANCPFDVTRRWLIDGNGDYGPNFFGVATNAATYLVDDIGFGLESFGGNVKVDGAWVKVKPLDAFRQRVYIAPRGLWLTLDSGTFDSVEVNTRTHAVRVGLSPSTPSTPVARLRIEQPAKVVGVGPYHPLPKLSAERGAFTVPLQNKLTWVELTD